VETTNRAVVTYRSIKQTIARNVNTQNAHHQQYNNVNSPPTPQQNHRIQNKCNNIVKMQMQQRHRSTSRVGQQTQTQEDRDVVNIDEMI